MQSGIRRCSILIFTDPQGLRGYRGVSERPGTEVGKCHRCSSSHASTVVCCKTPTLAFGFRPRERDITFLLLEKVCSFASIYMSSMVPRELDTQGGRAERFCGVLASAEGSKIKGKRAVGGGGTEKEEDLLCIMLVRQTERK